VNALSAQLEDSDDEEGYEEQLIRYKHDFEPDKRDATIGNLEAVEAFA
jgi:hypothetical protein